MNRIARWMLAWSALACLPGCTRNGVPATKAAPVIQVWGEKGAKQGQFIQPRDIAITHDGYAFVVDSSGRVQKFTTAGQFVKSWIMPSIDKGRPEGIALMKDGNLAICDTHYSKMRVYTPEGKLLLSFGSYGTGIGCFLLVTGVCVDPDGFIYASDYGGETDRVSKWTPQGQLVATWQGHGEGPRQFRRPCGLAISREGDLLVGDICNNRIQRLDRHTGAYKGTIGAPGRGPGQFIYPYGVAVDKDGFIFVVEYGTHRVQKLTPDGKFVATWGGPGRAVGQLANPWGLAVDADDNVYVADTENNRVQKFHF